MLFKVWLSVVLGLFLIMLSPVTAIIQCYVPNYPTLGGNTVESGAEVGLATHSLVSQNGMLFR